MPSTFPRHFSRWLRRVAAFVSLVISLHAYGQDTSIDTVGARSVGQQAQWLSHAAANGTLAALTDEQLVALFHSLDPRTLPLYLQQGLSRYASCEFTMLRRERIRGRWPRRADHMLVRVTREPLRIYAKWLPDGAHAGQEVIYDASKRPGQLYGHLGGVLGVLPMWTSLDGPLARAQSNHSSANSASMPSHSGSSTKDTGSPPPASRNRRISK